MNLFHTHSLQMCLQPLFFQQYNHQQLNYLKYLHFVLYLNYCIDGQILENLFQMTFYY